MSARILTREQALAESPPNLPEEVWEATPLMTRIRDFARTQGESPDAFFGLLLARFGTLLKPEWRIPHAKTGRSGSLNINIAIVGRSASGKSGVMRLAAEVMPNPNDPTIYLNAPISTGEGLIDFFLGSKRVKDEEGNTQIIKTQIRDRILYVKDEGEDLKSEHDRNGSKLLATIRTAWVGEDLGGITGSEIHRRILAAHSYRLNTIIGVQPKIANFLLKGADLGTPQRFIFLSSLDLNNTNYQEREDFTLEPDEELENADGMVQNELMGYRRPSLDETVRVEMEQRQRMVKAGLMVLDEHESHRDLAQQKIASYLALIHKSGIVTRQYWDLAGVIFDTSQSVVRWLIAVETAEKAARDQAAQQQHALREYAADALLEVKTAERLAATLARKVHRDGEDGLTYKEAEQALAGRDRAAAENLDVIDLALDKGWVERRDVDGDPRLFPGENLPPAASRGRR